MRAFASVRTLVRFAVSAIAIVGIPHLIHAQTSRDTAAVRQAALDYLEGFHEGDSTRLVRAVRPEVYKYGFFVPRGATAYSGERMEWKEFHSYANGVKKSGKPAPATAPKKIELLDLLDQTAAVKVTAFWGTDYLLMGQYDGRWMISHVLWQSPVRK
ncbi:MAG: nuclear transport factor 2 family protein [Phycisphaerae bacterium]|nr:nuclear transport factor 2 family protein [Gemmatimonadaceae bacterium]